MLEKLGSGDGDEGGSGGARPPLRWARAWDLRSHSSLVDVGSGYGKCVLHFAVENQLRRAAGIECVISRHEIASQVMQELHGELLLRPSLAAPAAAASADGEGGASEEAGAAAEVAEVADPYAASTPSIASSRVTRCARSRRS